MERQSQGIVADEDRRAKQNISIGPIGADRGSKANNTLLSIQYMRAAAAVGVVFYHQFQGQLHGIGNIGAHGVDLFFIISGFLMMNQTTDVARSPKQFALDRIARIVPTYWIATALYFATITVSPAPEFHKNTAIVHLLKSLLFLVDHDGSGSVFPTLFVGWTINYEAFFYALFAIVLLFGSKARIYILCIVFCAFISFGVILRPNGIGGFYTSPIIAEFLAGSLIATSLEKYIKAGSLMMFLLSLAAISLALLILSARFADLAYGAVAACLFGLGVVAETHWKFPVSKTALLIGAASYSIYLFQQFGFLASDWIGHSLIYDLFSQHSNKLDELVRVVIALCLGILAYLAIEKPATAAARRLLGRLNRERAEGAP